MSLTFSFSDTLPSEAGPIANFVTDKSPCACYATTTGMWVYVDSQNSQDVQHGAARDYYGSDIPGDYLTRTPYRRIWSDTNPLRWKLLIPATTTKGSSRIVLERPTRAFAVGDSVNFIESTDNDDDTTEIVNEAEIIAISPDWKTITVNANAQTTSTGYLTRVTYSSELAGYDDSMITGGNTILRLIELGESLIPCHDRGFLIMTPTGNSKQPFTTTEGYTGTDGLWLQWCAAVIGDKLLYRAKNRWMTISLLNMTPVENPLLANVRSIFDGLTLDDTEAAFCEYNAVDHEVWMFLPKSHDSGGHGGIVCYSVDTETIHTIDTSHDIVPVSFTGAGSVVRATIGETGAEDWWWMLGTEGGRIALMHVNDQDQPVSTRFGYEFPGIIEYGYFGSSPYEIQWQAYQVELSSASTYNYKVDISILSRQYHGSRPMNQFNVSFDDKTPPSMMRMAVRAAWISDSVTVYSGHHPAPPAIARRCIQYRVIGSNVSQSKIT